MKLFNSRKPYYKLTDLFNPVNKLEPYSKDNQKIDLQPTQITADYAIAEHSKTNERIIIYAKDSQLIFEKIFDE